RRPGAPGELERTRLRRIASEQTGPLEVREMRVDGRRRGQPDRLADLPHRGRIAVRVDVADEELPDLLLARRERHLAPLREHAFDQGSDVIGRSQAKRTRAHWRDGNDPRPPTTTPSRDEGR